MTLHIHRQGRPSSYGPETSHDGGSSKATVEMHQAGSSTQCSLPRPISDYSNVESWTMSLHQWSTQSIHTATTSEDSSTPHPPKRRVPSPDLECKTKFNTRNSRGKLLTFTDRESTLPRKLSGSKAGVYLVELQKRSSGWLGLQLDGSKDAPPTLPITIKAVLQGGAAYKSGLIREGDEVLEVNGASFEKLTLREAVTYMRELPAGKVDMILRDITRGRSLDSCRKRLFEES